MTKRAGCAYHPELPADTRCDRCGRMFCPDCIREWNRRQICPVCRQNRMRRRVLIAAVVAGMLALPAAGIIWGVHQRLTLGPDHARIRQRQRLLELFPDSPEIRLRLAHDFLQTGRVARARRELHKIIRRHPNHVGALYTLARLAHEKGDHREVLKWTGRVLIHARAATPARRLHAEAQVALGRPDKAEATLRAGLEANARATPLALMLSDLLAKQKRTQEALEILRSRLHHSATQDERQQIQSRITALGAGQR